MAESITFLTKSSEATQEAGKEIAKLLMLGDVVCLTGDLGAGKTTLIKGLSQSLGEIDRKSVV